MLYCCLLIAVLCCWRLFCALCVVRRLLVVDRCVLFVVCVEWWCLLRCLMFVVCCLLCGVCCLLIVVCCSALCVFLVCCVLDVVMCLVFAVYCLMFVDLWLIMCGCC